MTATIVSFPTPAEIAKFRRIEAFANAMRDDPEFRAAKIAKYGSGPMNPFAEIEAELTRQYLFPIERSKSLVPAGPIK